MAKPTAVLGFTLIVMLGVIAVPIAVDSTNSTEAHTVTLSEGETTQLNGDIQVSVITLSTTETEVNLINQENGENISRVIAEGEKETYPFTEGDVDVTATELTNQNAFLTVEYPTTFGYSENVELVTNNIALLLVVMLFIMIMAFVGVGGTNL